MATLHLPDNGQSLPIEDRIARDDALLRQALAIVYPGAANAEIKREEKNGELIVSVIKRAGTKGNALTALEIAPEEVNPALLLAYQLKKLERAGEFDLAVSIKVQDQVRKALAEGENEKDKIDTIVRVLKRLKPQPSSQVPTGF